MQTEDGGVPRLSVSSPFFSISSKELVAELGMARDGFHDAVLGIHPQRKRASLSLQPAAVSTQMFEKRSALHGTTRVSRWASGGTPRNASSRQSSRITAIASARFALHSSVVPPCPLAPGISGQYLMYPVSAFSIIAERLQHHV